MTIQVYCEGKNVQKLYPSRAKGCCEVGWVECRNEEVFALLMPLSLGVNFINVLQAAFSCKGPKSARKTDNLTVFFHSLDLHT